MILLSEIHSLYSGSFNFQINAIFLLNFLFGGSDVVFKSADEFTADLRGEGQGGRKKLIRETPEIGENL